MRQLHKSLHLPGFQAPKPTYVQPTNLHPAPLRTLFGEKNIFCRVVHSHRSQNHKTKFRDLLDTERYIWFRCRAKVHLFPHLPVVHLLNGYKEQNPHPPMHQALTGPFSSLHAYSRPHKVNPSTAHQDEKCENLKAPY